MKSVTFYFRNLEPTQGLHRFVLSFCITFMVDLTLGKILNMQEESQQVNYLYNYSFRAKGFISANVRVSAL